jgi:hypothetical protein
MFSIASSYSFIQFINFSELGIGLAVSFKENGED